MLGSPAAKLPIREYSRKLVVSPPHRAHPSDLLVNPKTFGPSNSLRHEWSATHSCYVLRGCAGLSDASVAIKIIRAIWQCPAYLRRSLRWWPPTCNCQNPKPTRKPTTLCSNSFNGLDPVLRLY